MEMPCGDGSLIDVIPEKQSKLEDVKNFRKKNDFWAVISRYPQCTGGSLGMLNMLGSGGGHWYQSLARVFPTSIVGRIQSPSLGDSRQVLYP